MRILNGWKQIGEYLNLTSRTAQRWERLGLPVRRVSDSSRSPVVAFSNEIEGWVQNKRMSGHGFDAVHANLIAFRATRHESRKLVKELRAARIEHQRLLNQVFEAALTRQKKPPILGRATAPPAKYQQQGCERNTSE